MRLTSNQYKMLCASVRAMWETREMNTADMAKVLNVPEHQVERASHYVTERRRVILNGINAR